jgi:HD-like signal output (HDOD) protein
MNFDGDLSKYHPADALMFLSHLSVGGVLSIAHDTAIITVGIQDGFLIDAQSLQGDQKILRCLRFQGLIDKAQHRHVLQIQSETGMPVRQILGELKIVSPSSLNPILTLGVHDVLLELFLLETGTFHFTDEGASHDETDIKLAIHPAALKISAQADEFRDFEKTVRSLDTPLDLNEAPDQQQKIQSTFERIILKLAADKATIAQILQKAPMANYEAMRTIQNLLNRNFLRLAAKRTPPPQSTARSFDPLFQSYKRALKKLITAGDVLKQLEALLSFCKDFFDGILILSSKGPEIVYCKTITFDPERRVQQRSVTGQFGKIDADPVFKAVNRSGIGFFGKIFPSGLLNKLIDPAPAGECALLSVQNRPGLSIFLYAYKTKVFPGLSPHHYLELLSWLIAPGGARHHAVAGQDPSTESVPDDSQVTSQTPLTSSEDSSTARADALVQKIEDLPPLPSLVAKALRHLSDPNANLAEVEAIVGQDQALVAKLIKVSNSALYGGYQQVNTLRAALARLGAKIAKSLILTAATRSYFFKNRNGTGVWGQFLWQHTVECGLAARRIAEAVDYDDPEEAFIGGIIHDIGKLVLLLRYPEKFKTIQQMVRADGLSDKQAEQDVIGCDHQEVGYVLLEKWKMPDSIKACARFHHDFAHAGDYQTLAAITAYGNHCSHAFGAHPIKHCRAEGASVAHPAAVVLNLSEERQAALRDAILSDFTNTDLIG